MELRPQKPGERYCARHDQTFSALKPCTRCRADPGPRLQAQAETIDDAVDRADENLARAIAARNFDRADEHRKRRSKTGDVDHMGENMIAKLDEVGLKALRLAREIHEKRQQLAEDRKLMDDYATISGARKAH